MGAIIGHIDRNLHKTPRKYVPRGKDEITFTPWQEQDLETKWNKYMNDVFETAKKRATNYMDTWLEELKKEWNSQKKKDEFKADPKDTQKEKDEKKTKEEQQKKILALVETTRKEFDKVKDWKKPDNWE